MTQKQKLCLMVSAAIVCISSACSTAGQKIPASDLSLNKNNSSWCQGDKIINYNPGSEENQNDPDNSLDSDETVNTIQKHNARYRAACPENISGE